MVLISVVGAIEHKTGDYGDNLKKIPKRYTKVGYKIRKFGKIALIRRNRSHSSHSFFPPKFRTGFIVSVSRGIKLLAAPN